MQINNVKNYKSVVYSKSFYEKLKAEQAHFKGKNSTRPKDANNCLIEEVDCERSISSLNNANTVYKKIGKPVVKLIKVTEKQLDKGSGNKKTIKAGAEKKIIEYKAASIDSMKREIVELDITEKEKCVIEEVDCKLSLVYIGYDDVQEEEETVNIPEIDIEPEKELALLTEDKQVDKQDEPEIPAEIQTDNGLAKEEENKEADYDINRYVSSSIVGTIVVYPGDKKEVENIPLEETSAEFIYEEDVYAKDNEACQEAILLDNSKDKLALWSAIQKNGKLFIQGVSTNFLHSEAIHTKNKLGFLSLLALFGLLGIFTENKACLGFWAFLYYTRYFYVKPDKDFNHHVLISASCGFATGIALSFLSVILEALFGKVSLLIYGMGAGMVISVIVFTTVLYVLQFWKIRETQEDSDKTEGLNPDAVIAMEQISSDTAVDAEEEISS